MIGFIFGVLLWSVRGWSSAQQEIIDQVRRCNDAWVASIAEKRFETYDAACPATEGAVFWYTTNPAPDTYKGPNGLWVKSSSENQSVSWSDLQPVAVQVDGDLAFIYYSVTWTVVPKSGQSTSNPSRRLHVFQRRNGRWLMAGGSVAPVPK
jgi:ketosteroid isomerase-like protein